MFRWLTRGLVFLVITFAVSETNQDPAAGLFAAIVIFALFYGALGLFCAVVRTVRITRQGTSK